MKKPLVLALMSAGALLTVQARNVFVPPAPGSTAPVIAFQGEPFTSLGSFPAGNTPFAVFPTLNGQKFYAVSKSTINGLVYLDQSLVPISGKPAATLQQAPDGAGLSPDGARLLILGGTVHVIDTSTDVELANIPITTGGTPVDVAFSIDSKKAFVISKASSNVFTSNSVVTAIDLTTNTVVSGQSFLAAGSNTTLTVSPNGLLYVTAQNRIYEVDPMTLLARNEIAITATPLKMVFTPEGKYGIAPNSQPSGGAQFYLLDLTTKQATPIGYPN